MGTQRATVLLMNLLICMDIVLQTYIVSEKLHVRVFDTIIHPHLPQSITIFNFWFRWNKSWTNNVREVWPFNGESWFLVTGSVGKWKPFN